MIQRGVTDLNFQISLIWIFVLTLSIQEGLRGYGYG